MKNRQRIDRRLARAFLLQLALISLTALLGIYSAKTVLEGILIRQALRDEAEYFWHHHWADPAAPLPNTRNMSSYLLPQQSPDQIPEELLTLGPGFHALSAEASFATAYVSAMQGETFFLVFDSRRVEELAVFFGMTPLAGVLIVLYSTALITYRISRKAVSPVIKLAEDVGRVDLRSLDTGLLALEHLPEAADQEARALSEALSRLATRLRHFIERERAFTRDVSHELRSPITVVRIAADLLLTQTALEPAQRDKVSRIKRASEQMEELTGAFLLLARESEAGFRDQAVCVNDIASEELESARPLLIGKAVSATTMASGRLSVAGSEKVLSVLIGNLIRNACAYTDAGYVRIRIEPHKICIEDSGTGIEEDQLEQVFEPFFRGTGLGPGHGVGLAIVKRLSDRFEWPLEISSLPGVGTCVTVNFPRAGFEPANDGPEHPEHSIGAVAGYGSQQRG
jgi:signal transduction histidine kinase